MGADVLMVPVASNTGMPEGDELVQQANDSYDQLRNDHVFKELKGHVQRTMSANDASHDFDHVLRVLALSRHILAGELRLGTTAGIRARPKTVFYAAYGFLKVCPFFFVPV